MESVLEPPSWKSNEAWQLPGFVVFRGTSFIALKLTTSPYDLIGQGYARHRVSDSRIAAAIHAALAPAVSIVNVGAGAGSYEPRDRRVIAIEPSAVMVQQRSREARRCAVLGRAEQLPVGDGRFDAAMAVLTIHHWSDWRLGIEEMRRVAGSVVIVTWDPAHEGFWLVRDYVPGILALDRSIFPPVDAIVSALATGPGVETTVASLPVPRDCSDGFLGAYWARPEAYLDESVRGAISSFARVSSDEGIGRLRRDLECGRWQEQNLALREADALDTGYRLIISRRMPAARAGSR